MRSDSPATAAQEWRRYGILPVVAALGMSATGLHIYGLGAFMEPLQREFGWTRAQVMSGAALVSLAIMLTAAPMGLLIDRWGPRRMALLGLPLIGASVALLGTATGTMVNWICLWVLIAASATFIQTPVWAAAVVTRFEASRGLALAVALCGGSIAIFALPLVATALLQAVGWRAAFAGMALGWILVLLPVIFFFFRGARDGGGTRRAVEVPAGALSGLTLRQALCTLDFYKLTLASGLFAVAIYGAVVHFIPILKGANVPPMAAAVAASFIGVFSLVGRLCTGAALDRLPATLVGAAAFLIPIPACLLLLNEVGGGVGHIGAAALLGLSMGAEMDVIIYLAARRFGLKNFGAVQSAIFVATAFGGATGPLLAGFVFDIAGGYGPYLTGIIVAMLLSSLLVGSVSGEKPALAAAEDTSPAASEARA